MPVASGRTASPRRAAPPPRCPRKGAYHVASARCDSAREPIAPDIAVVSSCRWGRRARARAKAPSPCPSGPRPSLGATRSCAASRWAGWESCCSRTHRRPAGCGSWSRSSGCGPSVRAIRRSSRCSSTRPGSPRPSTIPTSCAPTTWSRTTDPSSWSWSTCTASRWAGCSTPSGRPGSGCPWPTRSPSGSGSRPGCTTRTSAVGVDGRSRSTSSTATCRRPTCSSPTTGASRWLDFGIAKVDQPHVDHRGAGPQGQGLVHVARAVPGRGRRPAQRHVLPGDRAVGAAHGAAAVRGGQRVRDDEPGDDDRRALAEGVRAGPSRRAVCDHHQGPAAGSDAAVPDRTGPARGAGGVRVGARGAAVERGAGAVDRRPMWSSTVSVGRAQPGVPRPARVHPGGAPDAGSGAAAPLDIALAVAAAPWPGRWRSQPRRGRRTRGRRRPPRPPRRARSRSGPRSRSRRPKNSRPGAPRGTDAGARGGADRRGAAGGRRARAFAGADTLGRGTESPDEIPTPPDRAQGQGCRAPARSREPEPERDPEKAVRGVDGLLPSG